MRVIERYQISNGDWTGPRVFGTGDCRSQFPQLTERLNTNIEIYNEITIKYMKMGGS